MSWNDTPTYVQEVQERMAMGDDEDVAIEETADEYNVPISTVRDVWNDHNTLPRTKDTP